MSALTIHALTTSQPKEQESAAETLFDDNPTKDEWVMLGRLHGWKHVQDKANTQNATFGVLSALLITLSFPLFISQPNFSAFADDDGMSPCGVDTSKVSLCKVPHTCVVLG